MDYKSSSDDRQMMLSGEHDPIRGSSEFCIKSLVEVEISGMYPVRQASSVGRATEYRCSYHCCTVVPRSSSPVTLSEAKCCPQVPSNLIGYGKLAAIYDELYISAGMGVFAVVDSWDDLRRLCGRLPVR